VEIVALPNREVIFICRTGGNTAGHKKTKIGLYSSGDNDARGIT
jgi:hypothetical protein